MQIEYKELSEIRPYEKNPRKNDEAVEYVANSIKEFGFKVPIVVDSDGVIVAGHTRYKAAAKLNMKSVPCIIADDLSPEQVKAFRLADNKVGEMAEWDMDLLNLELDDIFDLDMADFGFEEEEEIEKYDEGVKGSVAEKYIVPPFSVLHAGAGYWQERKKMWTSFIHSKNGRKDDFYSGLTQLAAKSDQPTENAGTSVFDPVLTETLIKWFCPEHGKIIDPFTGGSVRGLIASFTGHDYIGIDLRQEQIDANREEYDNLQDMQDFYGEPLRSPVWITGDSMNIDKLVPADTGKFDFLLTCPPYADLEVYSDDERDLSNMPYEQFVKVYKEIIKKSTAMLADNAFAAIVIGEVRGKDGNYYNFVGDTINAFLEAGLGYYNEIVLETPIGTAAMRVNNTFGRYRKVVKGDAKKVELTDYQYDFDNSEEGLE